VSRRACAIALLLSLPGLVPPASADDQPRRGRLVVSVADQTPAMIPGAKVTVARQDDGGTGAAGAAPPALTDQAGVAIVGPLADGRYSIQVEFPGFATTVLQDVRVRGGDVRRRVTLQISKFDQQVTVERDKQSAALDTRGSAFSTVLTREQINALPDDPDELEQALKAMAPPGAAIRVDGFTGGKLPPKSQIRSIRLPKLDMFAAQNHGGMNFMMFIDIMTMPGNGPLRGNLDFNFLDDALNARNAFTAEKGREQVRQSAFGLSGTITPDRTGFSLNVSGGTQFSSPSLFAAMPDGSRNTTAIRQPRDSYGLTARIDHAITKDHAVRLSFDRTSSSSRGLGVGGYNLLSRAYSTDASSNTLRLSENGPMGRRLFTESRLQLRWTDTTSESATEEPSVVVQDAFTGGGAQQKGGQHAVEFELASDLDYVRGAHSWRTGLLLEGGTFRSNAASNYLGTYTFASLADYNAGRPSNFTVRLGDPTIRYSTLQAAAYLQDDWRVARSVLVSPGIRYGVQTHGGGAWNVSPRVSAAWSPTRSGSVTLRGSYGYFYDWIAGDVYRQTRLVDGARQRELNIQNPAFPVADLAGAAPPTNRYLWSDSLALPSANRFTLGLERTLTKNSRLTASYSRGWGRGLLRGSNQNYPADGVRPNPAVANDVRVTGDASSSSQGLSLFYSLVRVDKRRMFLSLNYAWAKSDTNTVGAFSMPVNRDDLAAEWGPSAMDARHRAGMGFGMSPFTNVSLSLNLSARSGLPYNVTTGRDDNQDGVFNDRPAGTTRNSARGAAGVDLGGRLSWGFGFGAPRRTNGSGGTQVAIRMGGDSGLSPGFGGAAAEKRYRLEFYVTVQNLLNRVNYTAYSFVLSSPLYGQPIAASQPRKVQVGARFGF
jgi:hypothetical protein